MQAILELTDIVSFRLCDFPEVHRAPSENVARRALKRVAHHAVRVEYNDARAGRQTEAHHVAPVAPRPLDKRLVAIVICRLIVRIFFIHS